MHPPTLPVVLTFSATDPSCGAGMQADLLTLASLGCHPVSIVTGITVQDSAGVEDFQALDADLVYDQARLILEDMQVSVFKVGLIGSPENVQIIAEIAADYPEIPLVLDPVLASGCGDEFATEDLIAAMRELLIPHSTIITPNSLEARRLAMNEDEEDEVLSLDECARRISALGCEFVLITGTHENTENVVNALYNHTGKLRSDSWARLSGSYHGSGCTLASAIAGRLATGVEISEAVKEAQEYTFQTLKHAYRPGMGQYIPDRLFWTRSDDTDKNNI